MADFGASYDSAASAITFRVFSANATRVDLCIYGSQCGAKECFRVEMMLQTGAPGIFTQTVTVATLMAAGVLSSVYYGYRAWGPNWVFNPAWMPGSAAGFLSDCDTSGNRFNPNKLLLDPYARESTHDPLTPVNNDPTLYLSGNSQRNIDTGPIAPKAIVLPPLPAGIAVPRPTHALKDDVIYEVHLRGLTKNDPSVPTPLRGTYAGAALKAPALKQLGITAVEFLPLQESQNDTNNLQPSTDNCN